MIFRSLLAAGTACLLLACGGDEDGDGGSEETADCAEGVTYAAVAAPFMEEYCVSCHSADVSGDDRLGAPDDINLDTENDVEEHGGHVYERLGDDIPAGMRMPPPGSPQPSAADKASVREWLECSGLSEHEGH